jgi:hypothetical protein
LKSKLVTPFDVCDAHLLSLVSHFRKDGSMNRRFSLMTGTIGALALVLGGMSVNVYAQRGAGVGHAAAPTNAGQGRATTAGRPDTAGRPATAGQAGTSGKANTNAGKPDTTGQPTIAEQLTRDHGLATQLQKLFPVGTDLVDASKKFTNLGQFVAAAHVADNNPNFTFDELKAKMLDGDGMSLGGAIHALDPRADATTEAQTAESQADADLKAAGRRR